MYMNKKFSRISGAFLTLQCFGQEYVVTVGWPLHQTLKPPSSKTFSSSLANFSNSNENVTLVSLGLHLV